MTKFFHIVQVHPVENGEPNMYKVEEEREFTNKMDAEYWIYIYNLNSRNSCAVYRGCVNDETGELV